MNTLEKLELLSETCSDNTELERIIGQLLNVILIRHRQKLAIYNSDLEQFEIKYQLTSEQFVEKFNSGSLGDEMDYFEWFGLCELRQDILQKIHKLEQAL